MNQTDSGSSAATPGIGPNGLPRTVRSIAAHSAIWSSVALAVTTLTQIAALSVLGRLLDPSDFGLMGMAMTVIGLFGGMSNLGLSNAIIQRQQITHDELHSLYIANVASGLLTAVVVLAVIPFATWYFHEPKVAQVLLALCVVFIVQGFGQQFTALLRKNLLFRLLAVIDVAGALASLVVGVLLALQHLGFYALVGQQVGQIVIKTVILCVIGYRRWRPRWHFRWTELRSYLSFGLYQMGERTFNMLANNVDYLIIGRFLGTTALGFYTVAYQLVTIPLNKINPVLTQFSFPVMSILQGENRRIADVYQRTLQLVVLVTLPLLIGLGLTARPAILVLFGSRWEASVPLIQALTLLGIFRCLNNLNGPVFLSKGRADFGFWQHVIKAVVNVGVFYVAVQAGVRMLAWSYSLLVVIEYLIVLFWIRHLVGLRLGPFARSLVPPISAAAVMAGAVLAVQWAIRLTGPAATWPVIAELMVEVAAGGLVYLGVMWLLDRELLLAVIQAVTKRGAANQPARS